MRRPKAYQQRKKSKLRQVTVVKRLFRSCWNAFGNDADGMIKAEDRNVQMKRVAKPISWKNVPIMTPTMLSLRDLVAIGKLPPSQQTSVMETISRFKTKRMSFHM